MIIKLLRVVFPLHQVYFSKNSQLVLHAVRPVRVIRNESVSCSESLFTREDNFPLVFVGITDRIHVRKFVIDINCIIQSVIQE
ncbi:hypothetical protein D3C86_1732590 [compost metagenome]